jgi:hypothetical protein
LDSKAQSEFYLSVPRDGSPDEPLKPKLSWTKAKVDQGYVLEVAGDQDFARVVLKKELAAAVTEYELEQKLEEGTTYYWRVSLNCGMPECPRALDSRSSRTFRRFSTALNLFGFLEQKGFKLQRVASGKEATEGAQFGFVNTINKQTVYTADFAVIWSKELGSAALQSTVEGKLKSSESDAEDAWRFKEAAIIDTAWGMYSSLGIKYETDQDFETRKLLFEGLVSPTAWPEGHLGVDTSASPIDFVWRPYMGLDLGHTNQIGSSTETESTVIRLYPRLRLEVRFQSIAAALRISQVLLNADYAFYYLPLEDTDQKHYFVVGGFGLQITGNFGFTVSFKKGNPPPKFQEVETLEGAFTVRFGS